jgi:hypothetical protein
MEEHSEQFSCSNCKKYIQLINDIFEVTLTRPTSLATNFEALVVIRAMIKNSGIRKN